MEGIKVSPQLEFENKADEKFNVNMPPIPSQHFHFNMLKLPKKEIG